MPLLNAGEAEKAEAMYGEVRKRAVSYTAYQKELSEYKDGAWDRIAIARKVGFQLRAQGRLTPLAPAEALASYREDPRTR